MTTNVYDVSAGLLTSDSRWSFEEAGWLVYVDDTDYNKIVWDAALAFLFAGGIGPIEKWKRWVTGGRKVAAPFDDTDEMSVIMVDIKTGEVVFNSDYLLQSGALDSPDAWYGGTGAPYAMDCWQVNKCAKTAVYSAKQRDQYSGGEVMYLQRHTQESNITVDAPSSNVIQQCQQRGYMINTVAPNEPVLVQDAANDPTNLVAQNIAMKVMSGAVKLGAPFPGMKQPWTQEKKQELQRVLDRYAPAKD